MWSIEWSGIVWWLSQVQYADWTRCGLETQSLPPGVSVWCCLVTGPAVLWIRNLVQSRDQPVVEERLVLFHLKTVLGQYRDWTQCSLETWLDMVWSLGSVPFGDCPLCVWGLEMVRTEDWAQSGQEILSGMVLSAYQTSHRGLRGVNPVQTENCAPCSMASGPDALQRLGHDVIERLARFSLEYEAESCVETVPNAVWRLGPVHSGDWDGTGGRLIPVGDRDCARCGLETGPSALGRRSLARLGDWAWYGIETLFYYICVPNADESVRG
ncbi:hypothetical protein chiPu_0028503, partial [Chiloscyllium punctatum]|nr:hypothetical protein [Chiloscyllium punctatum]